MAVTAAALRLLLMAAAAALLELACRAGWIAPTAVIPPTAMAAALLRILRDGSETNDLPATAARVNAAAVISAAGGLLLGLGLHATPRLRCTLELVLASWYAIPTARSIPS